MNNIVSYGVPANDIKLPEVITTQDGATFNPHMTKWSFCDGATTVSLDFSTISGATRALVGSIKVALAWYAENKSAHHLKNMFQRLRTLLRVVSSQKDKVLTQITSTDLINYRASLHAKNAWYIGSLSGFLKQWHALGIHGVSDDAIEFLKQVRLKGNQKGAAVRTMDPRRGPYSDIELESVQAALNAAYAAGNVDLDEYMLVWLFMLLGLRPIQYALLKTCDVSAGIAKDGSSVYSLRMPRAKQRGQTHRDEFTVRLLTPQVGKLLVIYAEQVKARFQGHLDDPSQAPLFPQKQSHLERPAKFRFHKATGAITGMLSEVLNKLHVRSERTGKPLHITATRFRYTIGTRAAMEGHGELIIAELLDHTDTQNVGVYVQSTPEMIERIDRAIAMAMAPLARAFAGVVIADESEAVRGGDPTSRIVDPRFDKNFKPVGSCGKYGSCGFMAPVACYTCHKFQPWLNGPHEAVLDYLLIERERLLRNTDKRIASNNDRTILAVAEVVQQCQTIRDGAMGVVHG